ncbi:MAG: hypothetical protein R3A52_12150 [Polyangiales bacterium]
MTAALGLAGALLAGVPARANGRFPQAQHLVVGPGAASDVVVLRATFSLAASDDGGRRFSFLCEDSFGYIDGYDPPIAVAGDGTLLVALTDGLVATRDWCAPRRRADLDGLRVTDLATSPTGSTVYATVVSNESPPSSRVARSLDDGVTWELSQDPIAGVALDTIDPAPSDPSRVYAAGRDASGAPVLARSDDGGARWRRLDLDASAWGQWFLSGVHPTRPDVLWLRAQPAGLGEGGDALLRSDDGGATVTVLHRARGAMRGFARSGDGERVWVGGPDDGLLRSDGGGAFAQVEARGVECLRWHAGALWVCRAFVPCGAMLSRWDDGDAAPHDVLGFHELEGPPAHCAAGTVTHDLCAARYPTVRSTIAPRACGADAGVDAGLDAGAVTPPSTPGCDCAVAPGRGRAAGRAAWAAALCAALAARRRGAPSTRRRRA